MRAAGAGVAGAVGSGVTEAASVMVAFLGEVGTFGLPHRVLDAPRAAVTGTCTFILEPVASQWRHSNGFPAREAEVGRMNVQLGRRCTFILVSGPRAA